MSENGGMSCKEFVELVTDYLDGAMSDEDRARFDAHLAICPPCVEYLAQIERTISVVGATWRDVQDTPEVADLLDLFRDWQHGPLAHLT